MSEAGEHREATPALTPRTPEPVEAPTVATPGPTPSGALFDSAMGAGMGAPSPDGLMWHLARSSVEERKAAVGDLNARVGNRRVARLIRVARDPIALQLARQAVPVPPAQPGRDSVSAEAFGKAERRLIARGNSDGGAGGAPSSGGGQGGGEGAPAAPSPAESPARPAPKKDDDSITLPLPDKQVFERIAHGKDWSATTGEVELWRATVPVPYVGAVDVLATVDASARAEYGAEVGPGTLRNNTVVVDSIEDLLGLGRFSGSGELYVPGDVTGTVTLRSAVAGGAQHHAGVAGKVEGALLATGKATAAAQMTAPVEFVVENGRLNFNASGQFVAEFSLLFDLGASVSASVEVKDAAAKGPQPAPGSSPGVPKGVPRMPDAAPSPLPLPDWLGPPKPPTEGAGELRKVWTKRWKLAGWEKAWKVEAKVLVDVIDGNPTAVITPKRPQLPDAGMLTGMLGMAEKPEEKADNGKPGEGPASEDPARDAALKEAAAACREACETVRRELHAANGWANSELAGHGLSADRRRELEKYVTGLKPMRQTSLDLDARYLGALELTKDPDPGIAALALEELRSITRDAKSLKSDFDGLPRPGEAPDPEKGEGGTMRFQVQWDSANKGPCFSDIASNDANGVTVGQALTALAAAVGKVVPAAARDAARPAEARQAGWIAQQPPTGIAQGGYSHSARFEYGGYTDARVDVENLRGHNLKS